MAMLRMTPEEFEQHQQRTQKQAAVNAGFQPGEKKPTVKSKHRNKPTTLDGLRFDSQGEALRWADLKSAQLNQEIKGLLRQVPFYLVVNDILVTTYRADFLYDEKQGDEWVRVVEDYKGKETPEFKIKEKLMLACFGITIYKTTKHDLKKKAKS